MILQHIGNLPAFRAAVRDWLAATVPADWPARMEAASAQEAADFERWWMSEKRKVGLATPHWPEAYGGAGLDLAHEVVLADEYVRANAPPTHLFIVAFYQAFATLYAFGSEEQKRTYLPGIGAGDVWCQMFSEPGAGSDLASLQSRAVRDGDHYVINGQKIWSSYSMFARYGLLMARTDASGPKHSGISMFVCPMDTPGVDVRPIRQANGESEFAEIFLTDVRLPASYLIGPEHEGWKVAQATLAAERGVIAFEHAERLRREMEDYLAAATESSADWVSDPEYRREFAALYAEIQSIRRMVRQVLHENQQAHAAASTLPAVVKLVATTHRQRLRDFQVRAEGLGSQFRRTTHKRGYEDPMFEYVTSYAATISAGSSEIMRNIIAERRLGLPR